ncbi:hypothetical protein CC1G_06675 [Coprinopsis cinerea okayama7|uniref:Nephrocystin 3-like N-terminal domain-containing protein n=1 Tax=Coprinopsis cinerea (strain Okayama-7 / 130 / ATCC MYA-4618 / FGSC 9003) TaxID=240176 RepID=A8P7Z3_COPC7|nr:hypothetical protein CC1G_06675 [Coprinopsis cinerea okayama7\|eukprot:XP_001839462.2 hypothetical protein CC1G_06675 [Coprinopsis cinerea okayama7\
MSEAAPILPAISVDIPLAKFKKIRNWDPRKEPMPKREPPGLKEKLFDSYFTEFTAFYLHVANLMEMDHRATVAQGVVYDTEDEGTLKVLFDRIVYLEGEWRESVKTKDRLHAQGFSREISETVKAYDSRRRASSRKAYKLLQTKVALRSPGYRILLKKRRLEASLFYAFHRIQKFNADFNEDVVADFARWMRNVSRQKPVFWLRGHDRCGKTVITYYFAQRCKDNAALAASYRFTDNINFEEFQTDFIASVVGEMSSYLGDSFSESLARLTDKLDLANPVVEREFLSRPLKDQLNELVVPAFNALPEDEKRPLLVVLDGIERCGDPECWALASLFDFITEAMAKLPICFFITSSTSSPKAGKINRFFTETPIAAQVAGREIAYDPMKTPKRATFPSNLYTDDSDDSDPEWE